MASSREFRRDSVVQDRLRFQEGRKSVRGFSRRKGVECHSLHGLQEDRLSFTRAGDGNPQLLMDKPKEGKKKKRSGDVKTERASAGKSQVPEQQTEQTAAGEDSELPRRKKLKTQDSSSQRQVKMGSPPPLDPLSHPRGLLDPTSTGHSAQGASSTVFLDYLGNQAGGSDDPFYAEDVVVRNAVVEVMSRCFSSHKRKFAIYDSVLRDLRKAKSEVESVLKSEAEHRAKFLTVSHDLNTREEECRNLQKDIKDWEAKLADRDVEIIELKGKNGRLRQEVKRLKQVVEAAKRGEGLPEFQVASLDSFADFRRYWGDISKAVDRANIKEVHPEWVLSFLGELQLSRPAAAKEHDEESGENEEEGEEKTGGDAEETGGASGKTGGGD